MRILLIIALVVSTPAFAQVGFYKSTEPAGISRQWSEMCIEAGSGSELNVTFFGGYCPTVGNDCANMRFGDLSFAVEPKANVLAHSSEECKLRITVGKRSAKVLQWGRCGKYNLFAGNYAKRASEVWVDDCSPRGNADTHHQ